MEYLVIFVIALGLYAMGGWWWVFWGIVILLALAVAYWRHSLK